MLPNGIRLIVYQDRTTPTVKVTGAVKHTAALEEPPGQEGILSVLDKLYSYGTTTFDRIPFQKMLDDIAADESAGNSFSLAVAQERLLLRYAAAGR